MPLQVIAAPEHDLNRSLGWIALWWIETFVQHGPGDVSGEPIVNNDEYSDFIASCYCLDEDGRRLYDSAFFSRPKGGNKSEVAAMLALFEALARAVSNATHSGRPCSHRVGKHTSSLGRYTRTSPVSQ